MSNVTAQDAIGAVMSFLPGVLDTIASVQGSALTPIEISAEIIGKALGFAQVAITDLAAGKSLDAVRKDMDDQLVDFIEALKVGPVPLP